MNPRAVLFALIACTFATLLVDASTAARRTLVGDDSDDDESVVVSALSASSPLSLPAAAPFDVFRHTRTAHDEARAAGLSFNTCAICIDVVKEVEDKGCVLVCKLLPNPLLQAICGWLIGSKLCPIVEKWLSERLSPADICAGGRLGFCNTNCACGECTNYTTTRCLAFPRNCSTTAHAADCDADRQRSQLALDTLARYGVSADEALRVVAANRQRVDEPEWKLPCLAGKCDASHESCCLTCF